MSELVIETEFSEGPKSFGSRVRFRGPRHLEISELFYDFTGDVLPKRPLTDDFALVALFPFAMKHGLDLRCGTVTREQIERLEEAQDAWVQWHPKKFNRVTIRAEKEIDCQAPAGRDAVISYSGGLDASFALHAHSRGLLGRRTNELKAAVLVHGFDVPLDRPDQFKLAKGRISRILASYGVPLTTVRTNVKSLRSYWGESFIFALASVLHQFSGTVSRAVIASDESYRSEVLGWGSNSITNHLTGNRVFPIDFTGAGYDRTGKAAALRNEKAVLENLRVCFEDPANNCGKCEKCIRTKLNFLTAGVPSLPALGPNRPTPAELEQMLITKKTTWPFYRELLEYGDWTGNEDLHRAIANLIKPTPWGFMRRSVNNFVRWKAPKRWTHFRKKHIGFRPAESRT